MSAGCRLLIKNFILQKYLIFITECAFRTPFYLFCAGKNTVLSIYTDDHL